MSKMLKFWRRIRYSSKSSGTSKVSRKTSSASGGMYRSDGIRNSGSPYRRGGRARPHGCVRVRLLEVGLLFDARFLVAGLQVAIDLLVPQQGAAGALLGLERRLP